MTPKQTWQLSPLDPIEIGREEDAVRQRDVACTGEVERSRVEIGTAFGFAPRIDGVGWIDEL